MAKATKTKADKKAGKAEKSTSPKGGWTKAIAEAKGIPIPYDMSAEFIEGALIEHPTFGKGVVEELVDHNKIKVIFEEGAKILIHKRS